MEPVDLYTVQCDVAEGDVRALKKLYDHFCDKLFQLAFVIVHSRQLAEEIVEDVFIKIWEQRAKLPGIENIKWYLYVLARNISLDYLRKSYGRRFFNIDEVNLPLYQVELTPEDILISAEIMKKINFTINDLPPKCRLIFKLVKEDGLKHKEVAELLNISLKTVEAQMSIALKRIHLSINIYLPRNH